MQTMSFLKNQKAAVAKAKIGGKRATWINTPGVFLVRITDLRESTTRTHEARIWHEFQIVESSDPANVPVGSERTQRINPHKQDSWDEEIKKLLLAIGEAAHPDDPDAAEAASLDLIARVDEVYGDGGDEVRGVVLKLETYNVTTQSGGEFTVHAWSAPDKPEADANPYC